MRLKSSLQTSTDECFAWSQMVSTAAREEEALEGFAFQLLPTHESPWTPDQAKVALSARMDARLVPSPASPGGDCSMTCMYLKRIGC